MEVLKTAEENRINTFEYKGKVYKFDLKGKISLIGKDKLPENLARVVPDGPLSFDENGILKPLSGVNDMVSLSTIDEWEKFARFRPREQFKVLVVRTTDLIGPTYLNLSTILINGEFLALVTKQSIVEEKRYGWQEAEIDYDYAKKAYRHNARLKKDYNQWIVKPKLGFKPIEL